MYWVLPRNFHEHCTNRAHQDTDNSIEVVPRESQGYKTSTLSANSLLGVLESIISVLIYFASDNDTNAKYDFWYVQYLSHSKKKC